MFFEVTTLEPNVVDHVAVDHFMDECLVPDSDKVCLKPMHDIRVSFRVMMPAKIMNDTYTAMVMLL